MGLLYQPLIIVEYRALAGKLRCLEKNLHQCYLVHHIFHMRHPGIEPGLSW
jgi:hypothetical protein